MWFRSGLAAALTLLLAGVAPAQDERTITASGEGRAAAVPDMATLRIGVTSDAGTAQEALARNSAALQEVLSRLRDEAIEPRDLQTSTLQLSPRYSDRPVGPAAAPQVAGFTARNTLTVRLRDLERLGTVLAATVAEGANTFDSLSFGLQQPEPLQEDALRLAVADARRKAEVLAAEAGVELGPVLRLDSTSGGGGPVMMEARMAMDSVPIAEGEVEFLANVVAVYGIAE